MKHHTGESQILLLATIQINNSLIIVHVCANQSSIICKCVLCSYGHWGL